MLSERNRRAGSAVHNDTETSFLGASPFRVTNNYRGCAVAGKIDIALSVGNALQARIEGSGDDANRSAPWPDEVEIVAGRSER